MPIPRFILIHREIDTARPITSQDYLCNQINYSSFYTHFNHGGIEKLLSVNIKTQYRHQIVTLHRHNTTHI